MIFNSVTYLLFLSIAVSLYWVLPRGPRLWLVFLGSLTFYGFWRVEFLPIMLVSTVTDYWAARAIHRTSVASRRRAFLYLSLTVNLGLLFYFKYLLFFAENVTGLLGFLGFDLEPPRLAIILPLGISFYTFQTISYTVDVYRGVIRPERNFVLYASYVTFFPQLVAGPILRAREVIPQLDIRARFALADFVIGLRRLLTGLFLKVFLADNIARSVDTGFAQSASALTALDVWTLAFLFGFQVYFDFSGYSHIALGCARMMGIRFPENFNFPYFATSPRDFWRRWHISLTSWIRDYLYLPLVSGRASDASTGGISAGLEQRGPERATRALFLTWAIMGLWHGANWTFLLWGLYHAVLVYADQRLMPFTRRLGLPPPLAAAGGWAMTLLLVMLGYVAFRCQTLGDAVVMYGKVLDPRAYGGLGLRENTYLMGAVILLGMVLTHAVAKSLVPALRERRIPWALAQTAAYAVIIALVFVYLRPINQFIYFQF